MNALKQQRTEAFCGLMERLINKTDLDLVNWESSQNNGHYRHNCKYEGYEYLFSFEEGSSGLPKYLFSIYNLAFSKGKLGHEAFSFNTNSDSIIDSLKLQTLPRLLNTAIVDSLSNERMKLEIQLLNLLLIDDDNDYGT